MLKQTLEAPYDPGPLRIDGDNVRFSSLEQLFSKGAELSTSPAFTVEIGTSNQMYSVTFGKKSLSEVKLEQRSTVQGRPATLRPDLSDDEIRAQFPRIEAKGKLIVLRTGFLLKVGLDTGTPITSQWSEPVFRKLIHVPGLRGTKFRVYKVAAPGPDFPGSFDDYVASVINQLGSSRP